MVDNYRSLNLEIRFRDDGEELLRGLENWLNLDLIDAGQVRYLARIYLTCNLELAPILTETPAIPQLSSSQISKPALVQNRNNQYITKVWQSFKQELSLRWLLFLGIFLVLISSVVLAASVWQFFPAYLQYLTLWIYTILFWLGARWCARTENLPLTTNTLKIITLLLIPLNFWAADNLGLITNWWQLIIASLASVSLLLIFNQVFRLSNNRTVWLSLFLLNYGHWFWWSLPLALLILSISNLITSYLLVKFRSFNRGKNYLLVYGLSLLWIRAFTDHFISLASLCLGISFLFWLITTQECPPKLRVLRDRLILIVLVLNLLITLPHSYSWQALLISLLIMTFSFVCIQRYRQRRYIFILFLTGLQGLFLIERTLPNAWRQGWSQWWLNYTGAVDFPETIYSFTFFFYLLLLLALAQWLDRNNQPRLALYTEKVSLVMGLGLLTLSCFNPVARSLYLYLASSILIYLAYHRSNLRAFRLHLAHLTIVGAIFSTLNWQFPQLSSNAWALILLVFMAIEWVIGSLNLNYLISSTNLVGWVMAGLSFVLLLYTRQNWSLAWLITPVTLTLTAQIFRPRDRYYRVLGSCLTLVIAQYLTLPIPELRIIGLTGAVIVMFINTIYLRSVPSALLHYSFALSLGISYFWPQRAPWGLLGGLTVLSLAYLSSNNSMIPSYYRQAAQIWGRLIAVTHLASLSFRIGWLTVAPQLQFLLAPFLTAVGLIGMSDPTSRNYSIYGVAWAGELLLVEAILLLNWGPLGLAFANLGVGIALVIWINRSDYRLTSLKVVPLLYALIALMLRLDSFNSNTALISLGIGIITGGLNWRYTSWKPLSYLALISVLVAAWELVLSQLLNISTIQGSDLILAFGLITGVMALAYLIIFKKAYPLLQLSPQELSFYGDSCWILSVLTQGVNLVSFHPLGFLSPGLALLLSWLLVTYALVKGKAQSWWVYGAVGNIFLTLLYLRLLWTPLAILDSWWLGIAAIAALIMLELPWRNWGWDPSPWGWSAIIVPALTVFITPTHPWQLILVALFYAYLSYKYRQIRWSYLGLLFANQGIWGWLWEMQVRDLFWYGLVLGLALLYLAQVEPWLQESNKRSYRHYLRLLGYGAIAFPALVWYQKTGLIPMVVGLIGIFSGISLRIRAFLFWGTFTLIFTVLYQLVFLLFLYPFLKWLMGLSLGIALIAIAANFERRRHQVTSAWQQWIQQLDQWD